MDIEGFSEFKWISLKFFEFKRRKGEVNSSNGLNMVDYAWHVIGRSTHGYIVQTYFECVINVMYIFNHGSKF